MTETRQRTPDEALKHNRSERNTLIAILDEHLNAGLESEHPGEFQLRVVFKHNMIVGKSAVRTIHYKND
jgi:hypothetical protein